MELVVFEQDKAYVRKALEDGVGGNGEGAKNGNNGSACKELSREFVGHFAQDNWV